MDRLNKAAQIGIGFVGLGFLVIFIAWNGAAEQNCVDCQIPFLISGGATGLGLIIIGAALIMFEAARRDRAHLEAKLTELTDAIQGRSHGSSNGSHVAAPPVAATAPVPSVTDPDLVVVGRSSYHRIDCRLVEGKEDLEYASRAEAQDRGLNACRVCDAAEAPAGRRRR
jgi:hypothetical protein